MFSFDSLNQANDELNKIRFEDFFKFNYKALIFYFRYSRFFLIDGDNQNLDSVKEQFKNISDPYPILFFYSIYDKNNMISYIAIYSNTVGIIYDLSIGTDLLSDIFNDKDLFSDYCLVPLKKQDKKNLSFLIDLSSNYFLNSVYISQGYDCLCLKNYVEDNILNRIDQNCKNRRHSKDFNFQTMIRLIVYYVPLIGIITDNLVFGPSYSTTGTLPKLDKDDFEEVLYIGGNSFQNSNLCLHKESFQFYTIDKMKDSERNKYFIQKEFYSKMYVMCENSCIIPCYGFFESQSYRGYESQNGFLFKFICNGKITDIKSRKKGIAVKCFDNTTRSLIAYRLLASITFLHEFGYYHRNVKPDHIFLDNENRAYFGGFATICKLSNTKNEAIGADAYQSPEQYSSNISSVHSDIYSFGLNFRYINTGGTNYYLKNNEKIDALFDECTNKYPELRPDSLILFIKMHELNTFLPYTNRTLIDNFFNFTFSSFLRTNFVEGKYLSQWVESLENGDFRNFFKNNFRIVFKNNFRNLILNNLPSTFIYKFSYTEMEANLNQALKSNVFLIDYDKVDIFQVNFFAEILNNKNLKNETDKIIESISMPSQIISRLFLYNNLQSGEDDDENPALNHLMQNEIDEFAENFDDCILLSSSFSMNPEYILNTIINGKQLKLNNAHNTVLYLQQIGNSFASIEVVIEILKHFEVISDSDIINLDLMYNTDRFSKEFGEKINNQPNIVKELEELNKNLEESSEKLNEILNKINELDNDEPSYLIEHNDLFETIDKIESEQKTIKLLEFKLTNG